MNGVVFGWPARSNTPHAFPATNTERTLCGTARDEGRSPAFIPADQQPGHIPPDLCARCAALMRSVGTRPARDDLAEGTCPECLGPVLLDTRGRIGAHGQWTWRHGGVATATKVPCAGAGERPEAAE